MTHKLRPAAAECRPAVGGRRSRAGRTSAPIALRWSGWWACMGLFARTRSRLDIQHRAAPGALPSHVLALGVPSTPGEQTTVLVITIHQMRQASACNRTAAPECTGGRMRRARGRTNAQARTAAPRLAIDEWRWPLPWPMRPQCLQVSLVESESLVYSESAFGHSTEFDPQLPS